MNKKKKLQIKKKEKQPFVGAPQKKVFLKILQNSQENTWGSLFNRRPKGLHIFKKGDSCTDVFL